MENMCLLSLLMYSQSLREEIKRFFCLFKYIVCVKKYARCLVTISFLQADSDQGRYLHVWVTYFLVLLKDKVKSRVHLEIRLLERIYLFMLPCLSGCP